MIQRGLGTSGHTLGYVKEATAYAHALESRKPFPGERFTDHSALVALAQLAISTYQKPNSLLLIPKGCKQHKLSHSQAEFLETTLSF